MPLKKYWSLLLLSGVAILSTGQGKFDTACMRFHTGRYRVINSETGSTTIIERTNDRQFETVPEKGLKLELKVTWQDPCNYTLKFLRIVSGKTDFPMQAYTIYCRMENIKSNGYTAVCTSENDRGQVFKFFLEKLK